MIPNPTLLTRIDEVLYYLWDPIGVNDEPNARDEYTSYARSIYGMVENNASPEKVAARLSSIMDEKMEINITSEISIKNLWIARIIAKYAWKERSSE